MDSHKAEKVDVSTSDDGSDGKTKRLCSMQRLIRNFQTPERRKY